MPFPFILAVPLAVKIGAAAVATAAAAKIAYDAKKKYDKDKEIKDLEVELNEERAKNAYYKQHEAKPKDLPDD